MVKQPKGIRSKVIGGYLLLFITAVVSVWFVYTEIAGLAGATPENTDNRKIIRISNTIARLYTSEALARSSILTANAADFDKYSLLLDSINNEINDIKLAVDTQQAQKFDTVQILLQQKKNSVAEIMRYREEANRKTTVRKAIRGIRSTKDSVRTNSPSIPVSNKYQWQEVANSLLTPKQLDSIRKLDVSNEGLAAAFEKVLGRQLIRENLLQGELLQKEQNLLDESRVISDQLRTILSSVQGDLIQKSYGQLQESRESLSRTADTMAWVGAGSFLVLLFLGWIVFRDLTSSQKYRRRLEILNEENENLLRSKSMLMATVTHDMRTPLGGIIGFYDLLKETEMSERQRQYLGNIRESADFILRLINDLLDFSKLENNSVTVEKVSFNMKSTVESACRTLEPLATNKGIELNWDIDEELNRNFISDPYRIKQVITNLIGNAIKFTQEGSVEVTGKIENGYINISVIDTGIGIAHEKQADVFREFTQAHSGIEKKFGGTGLGLTISRRISELLGGTIALESEEGKGSVFTLIIPCVPCNDSTPETETEQVDFTPYISGKKMLLVDDDEMQLQLMRELFAQYPVNVTTLNDGNDAIKLLETESFDIVLTDIQMPAMSGFELVEKIRNNDDATISKLPVVALSGKRDLTEEDFRGKGFTASHPKPIAMETLLALISNIFGNKAIPAAQKRKIVADENAPLYNLQSLKQFTGDDDESLKAILTTFSESAADNIVTLKRAVAEENRNKIAETAHKMIPMLRQMEANSIAGLLIPLEDNAENLSIEKIVELTAKAEEKIDTLLSALAQEVA